MEEYRWSELRLWNGGECPVDPADRVWVLFNNMENRSGFAYNYFWSHNGGPWDIIAYRVEVKPKPLIERWTNVYTNSAGEEWVGGTYYDTKNAARIAARFCASEALTLRAKPAQARQILLREVRE